VARDGALNAADVAEIGADADNHLIISSDNLTRHFTAL
jgi:hypothetical protein